jgi:apolipoprotein N-acyltransferase
MKEPRWLIGLVLSIATPCLLLLSFPTYDVHILGFFSLVPIFFLAYTTGAKKILIYGIVSGYIFYCLYLFWMNAYLAVVGVGFVTIVYGSYFVIALLLINLASRALPQYRAVLTPFIWISIEYIRSFGFLGFTFGSMGYSQHSFLPFIQIADIGGEPLVSFIIVLFNASLAHVIVFLWEKDWRIETTNIIRQCVPAFVSVFLILAAVFYGFIRLSEPIPMKPSMKLSLIQALSSPRTKWKKEKWKILNRLDMLSKESHKENPDTDLIVWTETAIRTSLRPNMIYGTAYHTRIKRLINSLNTYFIIGSPDNYRLKDTGTLDPDKLNRIYPEKDEEEVWTNSAYFLDNTGEILDKYDKIQLTPFGEHFPLGKNVPFLQKILDNFTDSAGFTPGDEHTVFHYKDFNFGVVICWEGTYGYFIRNYIKNGADFIINISNDMWTQTKAGHFQHFTITKFRAVENRIWFVRAANDGVTAFINPYGEVVKMLPIKELGYLTGTIGPKVRTTIYTRFGDILPRISLVVLGASFVFSIFLLSKKQVQRKPGRKRKK